MRRQGLTTIELLIAVVVVLSIVSVFLYAGNRSIRIAREEALKYELASLRRSIAAYMMMNEVPPISLTSFDWVKVNEVRNDDVKVPDDPFGRQYHYDEQTGLIHSQTRGYEAW